MKYTVKSGTALNFHPQIADVDLPLANQRCTRFMTINNPKLMNKYLTQMPDAALKG